ncbi:MAG: hypothetical protein ACKVW3_03720 [Phycisphaerales bacterium]
MNVRATVSVPLGLDKFWGVLTFSAGGKTVVYMARCVSTRGEKGPWSDSASATVAA